MAESGARPFRGDDDFGTDYPRRKRNRERRKAAPPKRRLTVKGKDHTRRRKADSLETFRCRHCRTIVGPTLSGGRHRNHCPVCLYSLHVDGNTPGDRRSDCHSLMAPVGLYARPSGEQVIVHRCLGCDFERFNRVAADDNPLSVMRLPLTESPLTEVSEVDDDRAASQ